MEFFDVLVDTVASLASLIAIVGVAFGWYRSARKPLKVTSVVVHRSAVETDFIVLIKNVKDYPVTIKRTDCYRTKKYGVKKRRGGKPEYSELFLGTEMVFTSRDNFEIAANGHTDIRFKVPGVPQMPSKFFFLLETSHGYQQLWCKEVVAVEIGKVEVYSVEYKKEFRSKWRAKTWYVVALIGGLATRYGRRLFGRDS